jgi:hypothetical protein
MSNIGGDRFTAFRQSRRSGGRDRDGAPDGGWFGIGGWSGIRHHSRNHQPHDPDPDPDRRTDAGQALAFRVISSAFAAR